MYDVLGLTQDAEAHQIKAAYRTLARHLHPDVNGGDTATTARLAEVNHAYETLSDPEARASYDRDLARQRAEAGRHYAVLAASAVVVFAATVAAVSSMARWHSQTAQASRAELPAPPRPISEPPVQSPMPIPAAVLAALRDGSRLALAPMSGGANWTTYRDIRFGFALRYPAGIFRFDPARSGAGAHTFVSRDGRAVLRIVAAELPGRTTLVSFGRALIRKRYAGPPKLRKVLRRKRWFALFGTSGKDVLVDRVTFACDSRSMHGWQLRYPKTQRATYDRLAELILRNYPYGNGPGAGCRQ